MENCKNIHGISFTAWMLSFFFWCMKGGYIHTRAYLSVSCPCADEQKHSCVEVHIFPRRLLQQSKRWAASQQISGGENPPGVLPDDLKKSTLRSTLLSFTTRSDDQRELYHAACWIHLPRFLSFGARVLAQGKRLTTAAVSGFREEYAALHKEEIDAILKTQEGLGQVR